MGLFGCTHKPAGRGVSRIERIYPFLGDHIYSYKEMVTQHECRDCSVVFVKRETVNEQMIQAMKEFELQESLKKPQPEKESK